MKMTEQEMVLPVQESQAHMEFGFNNYLHCQETAKPWDGVDETIPNQLEMLLDMAYWEQYTLGCGAISMQVCAMGPNWMPSVQAWHDQMDAACEQCLKGGLLGFPLLGYVGTLPE